jgi:catechol 2,3-dioxygenase-like lactoylglutathione lyase family enzyme
MRLARGNHVNLSVSDFDRSLDWYCRVRPGRRRQRERRASCHEQPDPLPEPSWPEHDGLRSRVWSSTLVKTGSRS